MTKFAGNIGYGIQTESTPGIWKEVITERFATGDLLNEVWRHKSSDKINDDISITNRISILAGKYVNDNKHSILYVMIDNIAWKVSTVEVLGPRLILNIGAMYNGKRPSLNA